MGSQNENERTLPVRFRCAQQQQQQWEVWKCIFPFRRIYGEPQPSNVSRSPPTYFSISICLFSSHPFGSLTVRSVDIELGTESRCALCMCLWPGIVSRACRKSAFIYFSSVIIIIWWFLQWTINACAKYFWFWITVECCRIGMAYWW